MTGKVEFVEPACVVVRPAGAKPDRPLSFLVGLVLSTDYRRGALGLPAHAHHAGVTRPCQVQYFYRYSSAKLYRVLLQLHRVHCRLC